MMCTGDIPLPWHCARAVQCGLPETGSLQGKDFSWPSVHLKSTLVWEARAVLALNYAKSACMFCGLF